MKKIDIIMISGKMHSGKGTFCTLLEEELNNRTDYNIIRCSLSDYIRKLVVDDFYYNGSQDSKECRDFMAIVYELGTKLYPYHKSRRVWERDILPNLKNGKNIVIIESFRERNDIDYFIKENTKWKKIKTIRINRTHKNYDMKDNHLSNHKSENDLDNYKFDYYIENNGTIDDLKQKINYLIKEII